jgi:hypothetical protein
LFPEKLVVNIATRSQTEERKLGVILRFGKLVGVS